MGLKLIGKLPPPAKLAHDRQDGAPARALTGNVKPEPSMR